MIGLEKPPWCQKFTCTNSLLPPLFLICIQSLLSSCIMLPHLSPSPFLSLCLPPSFPHYLPAFPSLSFCVSYHPALLHLHCGAALTIKNSAHIHTRTEAHERTHTFSLSHKHTHTGRHTPTTSGSPPPSLTPLHCRHETFYNPWCASASSRHTSGATSKQFCIHTRCGVLFKPHNYNNNNLRS